MLQKESLDPPQWIIGLFLDRYKVDCVLLMVGFCTYLYLVLINSTATPIDAIAIDSSMSAEDHILAFFMPFCQLQWLGGGEM